MGIRMTKATVLSETILSDHRFRLTLTEIAVEEDDGARRTLKHEVYHYKPAAAVLLYDPARAVVMLVRQFRVGAFLEGARQPLVEVCAGMLDADDPATCIIREAREETGLALAGARFVFSAFVSPGGSTERISCFVAPYAPADRVGAGGGVDDDEHIVVFETPMDEALAMIGRGEIEDFKTIALLYHARATGLV
jgi:nudix-type nucleoside diphosphatase (YffH/AdpP family)